MEKQIDQKNVNIGMYLTIQNISFIGFKSNSSNKD